MSIYRGFQIVVTPALRGAGEEPVMQKALEKRFPGCIVEFGAPDSLHGRLAVYPTPAMKAVVAIDAKAGQTSDKGDAGPSPARHRGAQGLGLSGTERISGSPLAVHPSTTRCPQTKSGKRRALRTMAWGT